MSCTSFLEHIKDVFEILIMAALVRCQGYPLRIFLDGCIYYFFCATVVSEVNDFCTGSLHNPPHDIDGGIMAIKERSCSDDANVMLWLIRRDRLIRFHDMEAKYGKSALPRAIRHEGYPETRSVSWP